LPRGLESDRAQATKISVTVLRAIENNRMEQLPDGIFLRGFLRAYAREVGLSPEDTVRRYPGQCEPVTNTIEVAKPATDEARAEHGFAARCEIDQNEAKRRAGHVQSLIGAVALVIGLLGYYTLTWWQAPAPRTTPPLSRPAGAIGLARSSWPAVLSTAAPATRPEAATTGSRELTPALATAGGLLQLDVRSQGLCWLSATVDGRRAAYRLMQPGEQQAIEVHDDVVLRIGDPAAFAFSINGMAGRSLGPAGGAATVHITSQNYREFLSR
jgi:cytoskeleton protein RodZ